MRRPQNVVRNWVHWTCLLVGCLTIGLAPARAASQTLCASDNWCDDNPFPGGTSVEDVHWFSPNNAFAVGSAGRIGQFDGVAWKGLDSGVTVRLRGVWGNSPTNLYAVGDGGTIIHFDGSGWVPQTNGVGNDLYAIWGSSPTDIWAAGHLYLLHTTDGGQNWSSQLSGAGVLHALWGTGASDIFAVGTGGAVLHYNGVSWSPQTSGAAQTLYGVWGSSSSDVIAVGGGGVIVHTLDGGTTWNPDTSGVTAPIYDVHGTSATDVFAVASNNYILHYSGAWTTQVGPGTEQFRDVVAFSSSDAYAVSAKSQIHHYAGVSWTTLLADIGDYLYGVWGMQGDDIFAAGLNGTIAHHDGDRWAPQDSGVSSGFFDIFGFASNDVFAVGAIGTIRRYDGSTWNGMSSATAQLLNGVWGSSATDVYAVGNGGTIQHYNGGGWSLQTSGTTERLESVWGPNAASVYAVGANGTILHTVDGGANWTAQTSGVTESLNDIWGPDAAHLYAVGNNGTVRETIDGGANWTLLNVGSTESFFNITGTSAADIYIAGTFGTILHYDGTSWTQEDSGAPTKHLQGVWAGNANRIVVTGDEATIRHKGPRLESCTIEPAAAPESNTTFVAIPGGAHNTASIAYAWELNGAPLADSGRQHLEPDRTLTGDAIVAACTPGDGVADGDTVRSPSLTVMAPVAGQFDSATIDSRWNMISAPLTAGPHLSDDVAYLYQWDEAGQFYDGGSGTSAPDAAPGRGYMGYVALGGGYDDGGAPLDGTGSEVPTTDFDLTGLTVSSGTFPGRHLLGNPFNHPIWVQNLQFRLPPVTPATEWTATIRALNSPLRDDFNGFGVHPEATDGWDGLHDASDSPGFNDPRVILDFPFASPPPDALAYDIRGPGPHTWNMEVEALNTTGAVTVDWVDIPATWTVTLTDTVASTTRSMNSVASYAYTPASSNETRAFTITATPNSPPPYVDFATAVANGWIENNAWMRYDNDAGQYLPFAGGGFDGKIFPWEAFWAHALTDADMRIPYSQPNPSPVLNADDNPAGWEIVLAASAGQLRDEYNAIGMHADATDAFDPFDATDGGTLNAAHVVLSIPAESGMTLARDIRPLRENAEWTISVEAVDTGPVTLHWSTPPDAILATLTDTVSGATVIMEDSFSYAYTPDGDEVREFTITTHTAPDRRGITSGAAGGHGGGGCAAMRGRPGAAPAALLLIALALPILRRQ